MQLMISCGEASGDLYAGALARELRALDPETRLFGLGGRRLEAAGAELLASYDGLAVTGLSEALAVLPRSWRVYRQLVDAARERRPAALVVIDFPDFNIRLARAVARLGVPVVYYISPQLWAWRPGRLRTIRRIVDRMLVIFPFEEAIYRDAGVPVEFVGHPLLELTAVERSADELRSRSGLRPDRPTIALLPGSRPNELRAIVPGMSTAARIVAARRDDVQFLVARAPGLPPELYDAFDGDGWPEGTRPVIVDSDTDGVLDAADLAVTASGTATVQCAIHDRPMVIVYRVSPLTYRVGKPLVRVSTYGMVNLIAGSSIMPELIQDDFTAEAVASEVLDMLSSPDRMARMHADLARVRKRLGGPGASRRAAQAIVRVASSNG